MGAVLREQNALPYGICRTISLMAKDDVDNVGAGRAAKGATLVTIFFYRNCSNQAHFLSPELTGVWKCVLLFRGDFALIARGLRNESMKSYCSSGKNPDF